MKKYTLRQQARAVKAIARELASPSLTAKELRTWEAVRAAATTLSALALIGEKKLLLADELYRAVGDYLANDGRGIDLAYNKLRAVVNRMEE